MIPGLANLLRCSVVEAFVGPVVVALDVCGDRGPGVFDGLEFVSPDAALLQLREPGLDKRLALRVAISAAAVNDPSPESTWRKRRAV
jgi:hypothetical protein